MLTTVAAADSAKVQKKSTAFLYIAKRNHTLCTLYINRLVNCVFYSIQSCALVTHEKTPNWQALDHSARRQPLKTILTHSCESTTLKHLTPVSRPMKDPIFQRFAIALFHHLTPRCSHFQLFS